MSRVDLDARKIDLAIVQTPSVRDGQVIERERSPGNERGKSPTVSTGKASSKIKGSTQSAPQRAKKEEPVSASLKSRSGKTEVASGRNDRTSRSTRPGKKKR